MQLQTNFGGGKTHSMLALYHLFSGATVSSLSGMDNVLRDEGVPSLPSVNRVVLVGNRISPGQSQHQRRPSRSADIVGRARLATRLGGRWRDRGSPGL